MAYFGATAAATAANPPSQFGRAMGGIPNTTGLSTANPVNTNGGGLWIYTTTDTSTQLQASTYFTDGWYLGMRPGDIVMSVHFATPGTTVIVSVGAIQTASTSGCGLSTASAMTSSFN